MSDVDPFDAFEDEMPDIEISDEPDVGWHVVIALQGFLGEKKGYTIRSAHFPGKFVWTPKTHVRAECLAPRFRQSKDGKQYLLKPLAYELRKLTGRLRKQCRNTPGWDCSCGFYALKEYEDARRYAMPKFTPPFGRSLQGIVGGIIVMRVNLWGAVNEYGDHYRGEFIEPVDGVMFFGSKKSRKAISDRYGISIRPARVKEYIGQ